MCEKRYKINRSNIEIYQMNVKNRFQADLK